MTVVCLPLQVSLQISLGAIFFSQPEKWTTVEEKSDLAPHGLPNVLYKCGGI